LPLLSGLHHVTCVCSDAQRTLDFYRDELGFSLVKKTVNFDDPHSYHLYLGDEVGAPGTLLTFFEWPRAEPGRLGRGTLESVGLETPGVAIKTELEDPDGLHLRLYPAAEPALRDVTMIGNPALYAGLLDEAAPILFAAPIEEAALIGTGSAHHVAWRVSGATEQQLWLERLEEVGLRPTPAQDQRYFQSAYFRMPDGLLNEIATDSPGFLVDEPLESLGRRLSLPPWLESERATLERELTPIG
jgi:glyoxalase family protein